MGAGERGVDKRVGVGVGIGVGICALRMAPALTASRRGNCRAGPVDWDTA